MSKRLAFKCYRSYFDVAMELDDKERLKFYDAVMKKQFLGIEPKLKGMSNFAYISQKHSIDAQVKGFEDKTKVKLFDPTQPPIEPPYLEEKEKEEVQVKEEEEEEVTFDKNSLMSEIIISDVPQEQVDYYNVANAFYQLFKQNAIDLQVRWAHLEKTTYKKCVTPIRLLATNDNRTRDEMLLVFDLLKKDLFWKQQIQTTEKLREKFDQLITKAQNYGKSEKRVTSEPYDLSCFDD